VTVNVKINGGNKINYHPGVTFEWNGYLKKCQKSAFQKLIITYQKPNVNKLFSNIEKKIQKCIFSQLCCDSECIFQLNQCHVQNLHISDVNGGGGWTRGTRSPRTQIRIFGSFLCLLERLRIVGGRKRIMFVAISTQFWNKASIYIRTEMLINVTKGLKLLQETVESNPGPHLDVLTYNCNGLGNQSKLK
jgi:hypothetical protein